ALDVDLLRLASLVADAGVEGVGFGAHRVGAYDDRTQAARARPMLGSLDELAADSRAPRPCVHDQPDDLGLVTRLDADPVFGMYPADQALPHFGYRDEMGR